MTLYTSLKSVASGLLQDKGQLVTFSREVSSGFDPILGANTTSTTTFTGYGAAFDYNKTEIDSEIVKRGDIRFVMEAIDTEPVPGDTATIDSKVYRVMNVKPTSPAGTVVIYEAQLRK